MFKLGRQGRIITLLVIDTSFFFLEVIVGYAVHSLALVADSFHMLNDVFSLIIALWAVKVSTSKAATMEYSYGWQRAEILGALINGVFLCALCLTIFLEALQRFVEPQTITNPVLVLVVGSAGLASNIIGLLLFHEHGHSHSHGGGSGGHSHSHGSDDGASFPDDDLSHDLDDPDALEISALLPDSVVQESLAQQQRRDRHVHDHAAATSVTEFDAAGQATERTSLLADIESSSHHSFAHSHASRTRDFNQKNGKKKPSQSLNMRGVFLHVLGDALGNIGVIATALFIWKTDYSWRFYFDPAISLFITIIIFTTALPLVKSASKILLQAAPKGIDMVDVKDEILALNGVKSVHDFHIWILRENLFIASLHVSVTVSADEFMELGREIRSCLHAYGIHSATIQPEFADSSSASTRSVQSSSNPTSDIQAPPPELSNDEFDQSCLCVDGCVEAACCVNKAEDHHEDDHTHSH
ncbi:cation efflux protein [Lipomyces japonicus]|uniref:cation efflux protein n=1 Tax=Lipomyces japonicus TaxID=56871 RepID=UPI0034CD28E9